MISCYQSLSQNFFKLNYKFIKRFLDFFTSLFVLTIFSPLYFVIAIAILLTSKGPVFYSHKRIGKNGKRFLCYKFRTMHNKSDKELELILNNNKFLKNEFLQKFKLTNDPRVNPLGRFLRKTSLDELPQFLNVLLGQMSIVGPRPIVEDEKVRYGNKINELLTVKPGITGWWQVKGRSSIEYSERKILDLFYVKNINFNFDLYILFRTIYILLFRSGKDAF